MDCLKVAVLSLMLMLASSTSFARSRVCNVVYQNFVKYCKKGDVIKVHDYYLDTYCDFSKAIVWIGNDREYKSYRMFHCIYIGYERKLIEAHNK